MEKLDSKFNLLYDGRVEKQKGRRNNMSEEIKINQTSVENDATVLSGAASYFKEVALIPSDGETTITANGNGQSNFDKSQKLIASFGAAIEKEVGNVRQLGATFEEYDNMMSKLWENGCRYETLTESKY